MSRKIPLYAWSFLSVDFWQTMDYDVWIWIQLAAVYLGGGYVAIVYVVLLSMCIEMLRIGYLQGTGQPSGNTSRPPD